MVGYFLNIFPRTFSVRLIFYFLSRQPSAFLQILSCSEIFNVDDMLMGFIRLFLLETRGIYKVALVGETWDL